MGTFGMLKIFFTTHFMLTVDTGTLCSRSKNVL